MTYQSNQRLLSKRKVYDQVISIDSDSEFEDTIIESPTAFKPFKFDEYTSLKVTITRCPRYGLGFTLKTSSRRKRVVVGTVRVQAPAYTSGLRSRDQVLSVQGTRSFSDKHDVIDLMRGQPIVELIVLRQVEDNLPKQSYECHNRSNDATLKPSHVNTIYESSELETSKASLHIYSDVLDQRTAGDGASQVSVYAARRPPQLNHAYSAPSRSQATPLHPATQLSAINETYTVLKHGGSAESLPNSSDDCCSYTTSSSSSYTPEVDTTRLTTSADALTTVTPDTSSVLNVSELEQGVSSMWLDQDEAGKLQRRSDIMSALLLAERRFIDDMVERRASITRPLAAIISDQQHDMIFKGLDNLCMVSELLLEEVAFKYDGLPNKGVGYKDNGLELQVYAEHIELMCQSYVEHCNAVQDSIYNFKVLQMSNSKFAYFLTKNQIDVPRFIILPLQHFISQRNLFMDLLTYTSPYSEEYLDLMCVVNYFRHSYKLMTRPLKEDYESSDIDSTIDFSYSNPESDFLFVN